VQLACVRKHVDELSLSLFAPNSLFADDPVGILKVLAKACGRDLDAHEAEMRLDKRGHVGLDMLEELRVVPVRGRSSGRAGSPSSSPMMSGS